MKYDIHVSSLPYFGGSPRRSSSCEARVCLRGRLFRLSTSDSLCEQSFCEATDQLSTYVRERWGRGFALRVLRCEWTADGLPLWCAVVSEVQSCCDFVQIGCSRYRIWWPSPIRPDFVSCGEHLRMLPEKQVVEKPA